MWVEIFSQPIFDELQQRTTKLAANEAELIVQMKGDTVAKIKHVFQQLSLQDLCKGAKVQTKSIFNIRKEKQNRYTLLYYVTFWTEITMGGEADRKVRILSLI